MTEELVDERPNKWRYWPREEKVNYLTLGKTRADLMEQIRTHIDSDRDSARLNKEEIAEVLLLVE